MTQPLLDTHRIGSPALGTILRWFEENHFIAIVDGQGVFRHVNEAWLQASQWGAHDVVGRRHTEIATGSSEYAERFEWVVAQALQGQDTQADVEFCRADGRRYWLRLQARAIRGDAGVIEGVALLGTDISERKKYEETIRLQKERLELVLDGGNIGCWDWNPQTNEVAFNERWCNMLGYALSEVPQQLSSWDNLVHPEDKAQCYADIGAHVRGERPFYQNIHRMKHRNGHWVYILDRGKVMERDEEGKPIRFSGTHTDVTEMKQLELQQQAQLSREAHQQGRLDMAAGILHDLGNALTGIGTRTVDLQAKLGPDRIQQNLKRLAAYLRTNEENLVKSLGEQKAKALVDLGEAIFVEYDTNRTRSLDSVNKLLAFVSHAQDLVTTHRTYSGAGVAPALVSLSIQTLLVDAHVMMSDSMVKRGVVFDVKCDPHLPSIVAERAKVMQVLINVLKNAVESFDDGASRVGSLHISVSAKVQGSGICVDVRDNGCGFGPDVAVRLFEDGFSTKGRESGFGLGTARRVIESLGGTLSLKSDGVGLGTTATIGLPITEGSHAIR